MSAQAMEPTVSINPTAPDVYVATKFAVTAGATDFNLAVGKNRHVYNADGTAIGEGVEYTHAFSVSPVAAKQLAAILSVAISKYEEAFGTIPIDPALSERLAAMIRPEKPPAAKSSTRRSTKTRAQ